MGDAQSGMEYLPRIGEAVIEAERMTPIKEPIVFDFTPAWCPVGLEWVTELAYMRFRIQAITGGRVYGRIEATMHGTPDNIARHTPKDGDDDMCHVKNTPRHWTYIVEINGKPMSEWNTLETAVLTLGMLAEITHLS